jgi:hypothetical protein
MAGVGPEIEFCIVLNPEGYQKEQKEPYSPY